MLSPESGGRARISTFGTRIFLSPPESRTVRAGLSAVLAADLEGHFDAGSKGDKIRFSEPR